MLRSRRVMMLCVMLGLLANGLAVCSEAEMPAPGSENEKTIWELEHDYWRYVEGNNLPAYQALWHRDFLGWPSVSAAPVRREHIIDWITTQTSERLAFKSVAFKPAAIQLTGDIALVCYWETFKWIAKDGSGAEQKIRVTHTWIKTGNRWEIIGGMSMPEPAGPAK
jgi:ketosteroid isomerase-like protein